MTGLKQINIIYIHYDAKSTVTSNIALIKISTLYCYRRCIDWGIPAIDLSIMSEELL